MLLCQGDCHVTHHIWTTQRDIHGDAFYGFEQFIDKGLGLWGSGKIKAVVLMGDLFDTITPNTAFLRFVREQIERCRAVSLPILYFDGNHDRRATPWLEAIHEWPTYIGDGRVTTIDGVVIRALDYSDYDTVENFVRGLDGEPCDILMLHQQCRQYMDIPGVWDFDLAWVPDNVRLVVMGHVHDAWSFDMGDGRQALYTGSTHMRAADQTYQKSTTLINKDLSVERLPLNERPFIAKTLTSVDELTTLDEWMRTVPEHSRLAPYIKLTYLTDIAEPVKIHIEALQQQYPNLIVSTKAVSLLSELATDVDVRELMDHMSIPELLSHLVNQEQEPLVFQLALALVTGVQPVEDVIADLYKAKFAGDTHAA